MKGLVIALLSISMLFSSALAFGNSLLSFKDWKQEKIHAAKQHIGHLRQKRHRAQTEAMNSEVKHIEKELSQENWNLQISKELSITDYFAIYLIHKNKGEFKKLALKLSTAEVAELMSAYTQSVTASPDLNPEGTLKLPIIANEVAK